MPLTRPGGTGAGWVTEGTRFHQPPRISEKSKKLKL